MEYVNKLLEIANNLHLNDQAALLRVFKERLESPNKEILIPLIGEFSSGKTSFINALLDNKNLETASRATTATIFEVRMGADSSKQVIIDSDGKAISVENDILDNKQLSDTQVVCVFDTSNKLDPSIVLVDTPGLSSNDPKHRIALSNYLPNADAILLVVDVNQSPTRSLISFVKDTQVSKRPIYLMLTKCDTKTPNEVAQQVKTVVEIIGLPEDNIICTSSHTNDLEQFYSLIKEIQVHKNDIVNEAIKRRIAIVADQIKDFVLELEKNVDSSNDLESAIQDQTRKLKELHTNTDALIEDASCEIEKKEEAAIRIFKDRVLKNLDTIIQSEGRDCDQSVYASVNSVGNMVIELYRQEIQSVLVKLGRERRHTSKEIPMQSLETIDLSGIAFDQFSYNLDLANAGHEHDKAFGYAALTLAAIAAVAVAAPAVAGTTGTAGAAGAAGTAGTAGAAGGAVAAGTAGAAGAAGGAVAAGTAGGAVATTIAGEAGEIVAGSMISRAIVRATKYAGKVGTKIETIKTADKTLKQKTGLDRGLIETATGWITDKITGKPARIRAINSYLEETLLPEFKGLLFNVRTNLIKLISDTIYQEVDSLVGSMQQTLLQMKDNLENAKQTANEQREILKSYINTIHEYE